MKYNGHAEAFIFDKENKTVHHADVYFDGSDLNRVSSLGLFSSRGYGILKDYLVENNIPYTHIITIDGGYIWGGCERENQIKIIERENYDFYAECYDHNLDDEIYESDIIQREHNIKFLTEYRYDDKEYRWIRR